MVRYLAVITFVWLFFAKTLAAENKVLIISSYGADYKWSNSIVDGIRAELKNSYPGIELNQEFLSSEFQGAPETWGEKMNVLLSNYHKNPPLAIILISDEAWMAYQDIHTNYLKDVPLILCAVKPHSISTSDFTKNINSLGLSHFKPTAEILKKYNATGVLREMNISGYISLMNNLIDGLDHFVFVTDNRFYGIYTRALLQQEVEKNYPHIPVNYIDARFVNTDSLQSILPHVPPTAGLLLTSWLTGEHGFEYSKDYIYSQMENKLSTPIFITNNIGLEKEYFVGGYFNEASFWGEKTAGMLMDILRGKKPKEIEPVIFHDDQCHIAWKVFKYYQLDEARLPLKVSFYNRPDSFFITYKYYIIGGAILFLIFILFYLYTLRSNFRLHNTQRLLLKSIGETQAANSELEKTQANLIIALRKAEESDRLKSAFLANMSHEIRTPLNAIVGFSSVIVEVESQEERMEFAGLIQSNSDLLLQLISDILDISKIEAGVLSLSPETVNAAEVCINAITSLHTKCKPNLKIFLCESVPSLTLYTDQNRLMQVIINLINNAIKFTPEGSIELGFFSYSDELMEFYIKDTGIGIPEDKRSYIFERFAKLNPYVEGSGLGLFICKTIVEIQGGEIGVDSTLGVGSRFWFRIPKISRQKEKSE